jgi:hypothetical protein
MLRVKTESDLHDLGLRFDSADPSKVVPLDQPQKVPVEGFPLSSATGMPIAQGVEDEDSLARHAVLINRRINETGATLAQLYHELGISLLRLRAIPKYGAYGKWEGWLKRWGISEKRWQQAKTIAQEYDQPQQLGQITVQKAYNRAAAKRKVRKGRIVAPQPVTGETYEPAANIRLRCCDFRDLDIEPGTAKAVVTDPPWARSWVPNLPALGEFCARVLREDGVAVFFYGAQCLPEFVEAMKGKLTYQWQMFSVYLRPGLLQRSVQFISKYQMALVYSKSLFNLRQPVEDVMPDGNKNKELHPWARNLLPVRYCVEAFTEPGELVCDPLGGSFTTAEACYLGQRHCIACDNDPACLELAKKRFNGVRAALYDQLVEEAAINVTDGGQAAI